MLSVQTFSVTCLFLWGLIATYPILWIVNKITPIRLSPQDEVLGCDFIEHYIGDENEKMIPPLDAVQIANARFQISNSTFSSNESFNKFDNTLSKRVPFGVHQVNDHDNSTQNRERL